MDNFFWHWSENVILGILGRSEAALYFTMKKKMPKKAPWGELPGKILGEEDAPW